MYMKRILPVTATCALVVAGLVAGTLCAEMAPDVTLGGFSVGDVKLMCRERHGWKVDFRREGGKDGQRGKRAERATVRRKREKSFHHWWASVALYDSRGAFS